MKRFIFPFLFSVLLTTYASAETFEKVIERQPPETAKGFFGMTDYILSKTNNLLDGVLATVTGINEGDLKTILNGFEQSTSTFKKYREDHKVALDNELKEKDRDVKSLLASGAKGEVLAKAYLELGRSATEAGDFAKAREALAEGIKIAENPSQPMPALQADILLAMADCAYMSFDTEYMLNVSDRLDKLAATEGNNNVTGRVYAKLASGRSDMCIGNNVGAMRKFREAWDLAMSEDKFDFSDPTFNRLQMELLKKFPDLGMLSECMDILNTFMGDKSPIRSSLSPETQAQMNIVLADCHSRLSNHWKAFDNIFKARDIIHKAYPDGSIVELEYLVTLGDILRRNALDKDKSQTNNYTNKGVLYHLKPC